jgi:hypothetical protein
VRGDSRPIRWLEAPEDHDYPAALSYLRLIFPPATAAGYVRKLRAAKVVEFKSKDILRASGLSALGVSNKHCERDLEKIVEGKALSPLLLVRHPATARVIVADGYHRLCAVYSFDEDAVIPAKIV